MTITAAQVKELREKTGAGMMECKAALVAAAGDFARAEEELKERGLAVAKKREDRETNEGRIFIHRTESRAALLELKCETDFVSLNDQFVALGERCVRELLASGPDRIPAMIAETISVIKENIVLGRTALLEASDGEFLVDYLHGVGSFASIVKLQAPPQSNPDLRGGDGLPEKLATIGHELALHIVARGPRFISPAEIPPADREEAEARFREELAEQGKPEQLWPKIVEGRWAKFVRESCLLEQPFLKDEDRSVAEWLALAAHDAGAEALRITDFAYAGISDKY